MPDTSRRRFLKTAPLAAAAPAAPASAADTAKSDRKPYRRARFAPDGAPKKISESLWVFADTCNVYVVRAGNRCVLIDFGSGKILDHLREMGVTQVDWVLHTHHHRDQCQGDYRAVERGIPIAVPAHERHLFADAENFWRNRRVFHLYYVRNDFNTITENIPAARALADYSMFRWEQGKMDFFVLPTPGHTLGAITLLASVDGKKTAFSGDLVYAPGKIATLFDTQVNYGGAEGIDLGIYSLARLREQKPSLVCPSHGEPLAGPDSGIAETIRRLTDYYRFQTGNDPSEENRPYAVSPHLICHYQTTSSFYAIVSNSGKAMFIDYGSASGMHFGNFERATATTDRIRFVEHNIDNLKRNFGVKSVDVAMPSHMHDDHMNGFPHLKRHHGTKVWCYQNMVDVFQNPRGHNLGCILGEPFQVDRAFRHGEKFRWEEFEFEMTHSPGHTEYQMALFVTIDGNRVAFTGDAFFPNPRNDGTMRHNLIFRNHVENDSHMKSIRNLIDHEPSLIAPGHGRAYPVDKAIMLATEQKLRRQQQFFFDLLPEGETDFGLDPSWVKIYPYQMLIAPGATQQAEVRVQNYRPGPMKVEVALITPSEWRVEPDVLEFEVPAKGHGKKSFTIAIPKGWSAPSPRLAIAADVRAGGRYLGQITEAVVDLAGA
ncbi:MAG: MBL fold metallo-hydrolase [Acidobacteria bacterium]|nr:MBL fold metallo-hydrolase [Acidobacteriota bacterium]